jgi:hypothetical protein
MNPFIFSDVPLDQGLMYLTVVLAEDEFSAASSALMADNSQLQQYLERGIVNGNFLARDVSDAFRELYQCCESHLVHGDGQLLFAVVNGSVVTEPETDSV